jgi:hypothetical protein
MRRRQTRPRAPDRSAESRAQAQFEQFGLEWLRAIARGGEAGAATQSLMAFAETAQCGRIPWREPIEEAARTLERRCAEYAQASELDAAMFDQARAALLLLAEALATDRLASARRSARSLDLHRATGRFVQACERRARSEGWSYLDLIGKSLDAETP